MWTMLKSQTVQISLLGECTLTSLLAVSEAKKTPINLPWLLKEKDGTERQNEDM